MKKIMMDRRQLLALAAAAGSVALAGCSSDSSSDEGSATSSTDDATEEASYTLVADGYLTVGTSAEYEPFEYMEDGEYKGFDLDMITIIAENLGLTVEFVNTDFDALITGVAAGTQYDCAIGAITITTERLETVDFSDAYYTDDLSVVTLIDNADITADNYTDVLGAEGAIISVQSGSTAEDYAQENFPSATLSSYKNATDCFAELQAGGADALITNKAVAYQMVASAYDNCQVIKNISTGEEYGIAISQDNPGLTEAINEQLAALTEDGTIDELMAEYNIG